MNILFFLFSIHIVQQFSIFFIVQMQTMPQGEMAYFFNPDASSLNSRTEIFCIYVHKKSFTQLYAHLSRKFLSFK